MDGRILGKEDALPGKTNPRYLAVDGFKLCTECGHVRPVSDFYVRKAAPDGYRNDCRECVSARSRDWYRDNREHSLEVTRQYQQDNRDKIREKVRERCGTDEYREKARNYRAKNRDKINGQMREMRASSPERFRRYDLKRRLKKFGVTLEEYEALLESQGGVCAICQGPPNGKDPDIFHADHDHQTGTLRGLLCHSCNTSLGHFRDSVEALRRAIAYLEEPPFRRIAAGTLF